VDETTSAACPSAGDFQREAPASRCLPRDEHRPAVGAACSDAADDFLFTAVEANVAVGATARAGFSVQVQPPAC
jgi:hypothetical protein